MSTASKRFKQPILIAAGVGSGTSSQHTHDELGPSLSWQVDEAVVALSRAAIARGIPLAIPIDSHYAPLVAHVAAEYVSPEVAEGEKPRAASGNQREGLRMISLVGLGKTSTRKRATPKWAEVFSELKVVSDEVLPLATFLGRFRPSCIVGVGWGPKVNELLNAGHEMQIDCRRLVTPAVKVVSGQALSDSWADQIEKDLAEMRQHLRIVSVQTGSRLRDDGGDPQEADPPPFFRLYPPLSLYAQLLVEKLD